MDELQKGEAATAKDPDPRQKRPEFLIEVYKQMMADINRHIIVVWQSVGVVIGSFAIMGLVEKKVISLDVAAVLLLAICMWSLLLLVDASYWYNRNLCIIANIERLFLTTEDLKHVHYYFGLHRPNNKMITTILIQYRFAMTVAVLVMLYHFGERVVPAVGVPLTWHDLSRAAPCCFAIYALIAIQRMRASRDNSYQEFVYNSPGITVDTSGVRYGPGHGAGGGSSG